MILVDSSVWIDFFNSATGRAGTEIELLIQGSQRFALTGVIVAEVLQGLKRDVDRIEQWLSQWELIEPRGFTTYREAASIFRQARQKGITLTTIDALIAAVALEHSATLFTLDNDFVRIAPLTGLVLHTLPPIN